MTDDLERLLTRLSKRYGAYALALVGLLAALLAVWLFRGYGGRPEVGEKLTDIRRDMETNERRVENILEAAKHKEEEAKHETIEKVGAVSDDALPDLLAGLLADWRKSH
ncbi:MAG: hypothetical protein J6S60_06675 [Oscillospiraceae bacterium]|nr:hypothetical protein [Oscillospiraceae bacterium]